MASFRKLVPQARSASSFRKLVPQARSASAFRKRVPQARSASQSYSEQLLREPLGIEDWHTPARSTSVEGAIRRVRDLRRGCEPGIAPDGERAARE